MNLRKLVKLGFKNLASNKMRTGLAMLGIIIGIGSVIILISIGQASTRSVQEQIQSIGSNLLTISPGSTTVSGVRGAAGNAQTLTYDDAEAIRNSSSVTTIDAVSPEYSGFAQIVAGRNNTNTQVYGVESVYAEVRRVSISAGSFINDYQVKSMSKVAVLGPTTAEDLFGEGVNPVGESIRIQGINFTVIGVTQEKGGSVQDQDDRVYIPLTTAQKQIFGSDYLSSIALEVNSEDNMVLAQNQVGYLLLSQHGIKDVASADFRIMSQADILETATEIAGTLSSMLTGIAAISLLVGGIGIMNIMLMSVTERTREIGLRKALGAKRKIIIMQFLVEAVILTVVGGIVGTSVGILGFYIYATINDSLFVLSTGSIILAFAVSAGIGIVFGWYPARRASELQPIEALRYE